MLYSGINNYIYHDIGTTRKQSKSSLISKTIPYRGANNICYLCRNKNNTIEKKKEMHNNNLTMEKKPRTQISSLSILRRNVRQKILLQIMNIPNSSIM